MSDRAAFVAAIEAEPDNDLPRLVFADWLDDQGDARSRYRAELIRRQCAVGSPEADERAAIVLDTLARVWPHDLIPSGYRFEQSYPSIQSTNLRTYFDRGCLSALRLDASRFEAVAERFTGREPLLDLVLQADYDIPGRLTVCSHLSRVVVVSGYGFGPILGSPHLTRLRTVTGIHPDEVAPLAAGPAAERVRSLSVIADGDDSPADLARTLADTPAFAGLQDLHLIDCGFAAADHRTLIASPHLSPSLLLSNSGRGHPKPRSAVARDLAARFPGPPPAS